MRPSHTTMQALVYHGPGRKSLQNHPKPGLQGPGDAIVRLTRTTVCGSDLHILRGDIPTCRPGTVLGQEGVGIVEAVGSAVTAFEPGDRVLISGISGCSRCEPCRRGLPSHCATGGGMLGHTIDGTQAEFVRVPHADRSLYPIPQGADEAALVMLSGILPTGFECGMLRGKVKPGGSAAIIGAGPLGLAALLTAQLHAPSTLIVVDADTQWLDMALRFGATAVVNNGAGGAAGQVLELTGRRGVDAAVDTLDTAAADTLCRDIVAAGGAIVSVGVPGRAADPAGLQMPPRAPDTTPDG
jgi:alcohol dehydrogenase